CALFTLLKLRNSLATAPLSPLTAQLLADFHSQMRKGNKTFHLIEMFVNWTQAQNYCRHHHTDLASGLDQVDGEELKSVKNYKGVNNAWIGLFRDSWRWSDGSDFSFRFWEMKLFNDGQSSSTCAMTLLNRSGRWSSDGFFTKIYHH
uniref:C-type lectin domain-containing protein n=1 Tax=Amphilophus citrinellus TaxID=61819 RepID=A0A3Q0R834_AMPCI